MADSELEESWIRMYGEKQYGINLELREASRPSYHYTIDGITILEQAMGSPFWGTKFIPSSVKRQKLLLL